MVSPDVALKPETALQISIVRQLRVLFPGIVLFHSPQGFELSGQSWLPTAMGTLAGLPDLGFLFPNRPVCWIELKTPGGTLSAVQAETISLLRRLGNPVEICRSLDEVVAALHSWGAVPRGRVMA